MSDCFRGWVPFLLFCLHKYQVTSGQVGTVGVGGNNVKHKVCEVFKLWTSHNREKLFRRKDLLINQSIQGVYLRSLACNTYFDKTGL